MGNKNVVNIQFFEIQFFYYHGAFREQNPDFSVFFLYLYTILW